MTQTPSDSGWQPDAFIKQQFAGAWPELPRPLVDKIRQDWPLASASLHSGDLGPFNEFADRVAIIGRQADLPELTHKP